MSIARSVREFILSKSFVTIVMVAVTHMILISLTKVTVNRSLNGDEARIMGGLFSFLVSMITEPVIGICALYGFGKIHGLHSKSSVLDFVKEPFFEWVVVSVRVLGRMLIGLLLFIIPGIIEYIRLLLATPMVFFDKRMDDPSFDPVMESRKKIPLNSPFLIPLFLVIMMFPLAVQALTQTQSVFFESTTAILLGCFFAIIHSLTITLTYAYLFHVYTKLNHSS